MVTVVGKNIPISNQEGQEQIRVTVSYLFAGEGPGGEKELQEVSKEFSAADLAGRTTMFQKEERRFSVGDRIVTLKKTANSICKTERSG